MAFREPLDWLHSWWRYRTREQIADPSHPAHKNYAGSVTFDQFARAYIDGTERFAQVGSQARMVKGNPKQPGVDRIFRYERLDLLIEYLCEKVGEEVEVESLNVSPHKPYELSPACKNALQEFLTLDYHFYAQAENG